MRLAAGLRTELATEKPDARGMGWKQYTDRYGRQPTSSPDRSSGRSQMEAKM